MPEKLFILCLAIALVVGVIISKWPQEHEPPELGEFRIVQKGDYLFLYFEDSSTPPYIIDTSDPNIDSLIPFTAIP